MTGLLVVAANFSTISASAVVENVEIAPGRVSGGISLGGAIVVTKLAITSPQKKRVEMTFDKSGMETMAFFGQWYVDVTNLWFKREDGL